VQEALGSGSLGRGGECDDRVVVDGAERVLAPGLLDGGAERTEDVVDVRQVGYDGEPRDDRR
jgi:hypothetical protein